LDVGCGHGFVFEFLRRIGANAIGMDINPENLKVKTRGSFLLGDAENLPFRNGSFDVAIAFELVEHLRNPNKALREFFRCLKSNGMLLLTTPTPISPTATYPGHVSVRERSYWKHELEAIGFQTKIVTYELSIH
jgi:ubiquinone/menaquinone biosynthesis C-methylase UbiE